MIVHSVCVLYVCVRVRALPVCVCACLHACVRACVRACACVCVLLSLPTVLRAACFAWFRRSVWCGTDCWICSGWVHIRSPTPTYPSRWWSHMYSTVSRNRVASRNKVAWQARVYAVPYREYSRHRETHNENQRRYSLDRQWRLATRTPPRTCMYSLRSESNTH